MIKSKKINMIAALAMVFALIAVSALMFMGAAAKESGIKSEPAYAEKVFGTDVITVEIIADEEDWREMLDNAASEQYIMVDVVVNGVKFQNVGIRPKGNSSLTQVAQSSSDRYSFRLQFDEYINQTCFGLSSFVLNNMMGDYTYMKEYVSYDLMREAGVETPYYGFADIKVNGESWGLYLAVELYNESYEQRVFGTESGMLYNVKSMDMGDNDIVSNTQSPDIGDISGDFTQRQRGNRGNWSDTENGAQPNQSTEGQQGGAFPGGGEGFTPPDMSQGNFPGGGMNMGGGMGGMGGNGGSLEYADDNSSSYGAIFNNVVGKGTESDYQRVIEALKALSEGRELEKYFDVDQILRYLAAHTVVVNLDSYSSGMAQNYYIYENDGKITILPWDYNLAWGGFQSGNASSAVNFPIDTPVSGVEMSARPLLEKLFAVPEYLERYHGYLRELMDNYFANGSFEAKINELDALISSYVENDQTAFCTYQEYRDSLQALILLGNLRAESIHGQLDGSVPSTTAGQSANPDALVSADGLNLSLLGSMTGGGMGRGGQNGGSAEEQNGQFEFPGADGMESFDWNVIQQAMELLQESGGELTQEVIEKLLELGLTEEQIEQFSSFGSRMPGLGTATEGATRPDTPENLALPNAAGSRLNQGELPVSGGWSGSYLILIIALAACLLAAILITMKLKRKF